MAVVQVAYNPLLVRCIANGVPVLDPADTEDAFRIRYNDDRVTIQKGMYGDAAFEFMVATDGQFVIKLKAKSPTNRLFSLWERQLLQFTMLYTNKNTNTERASCPACAVQTVAEVSSGVSAPDREWTIGATNILLEQDGNKIISAV